MLDSSKLTFCSLNKQNTSKGEKYRVRVSRKIVDKDVVIPIGYNYSTAIRAILAIEDYLKKCYQGNQNIDKDEIQKIIDIYKDENINKVKVVKKDDLIALWDSYVHYHKDILKSWSEAYVRTHIQTNTSLIYECPFQNISEINDIFEWYLSDPKRKIATSKERLKMVVSCIDWNAKNDNIERKWGLKYRDKLEQIRLSKAQTEKEEIRIYTKQELSMILDGFKTGLTSKYPEKLRQYYPYVLFCTLTGCRPSEAIALKWENVNFRINQIRFCESEVQASGKRVKNERTKTEAFRDFPMNQELRDLLLSIRKSEGYVFTRNDGSPIHQHTFNGVWNRLLIALNIPYGVPYNLRHTAISNWSNEEIDVVKIADICGNSPDVIASNYRKLDVSKINLPSRDL